MKPGRLDRWKNGVGLLLLAAAFGGSLWNVFSRRLQTLDPAARVLRLAHWQLEPGYREAIDRIAAEYRRLHPDVTIIQIPVPERGYVQWVNTQLVGGTAPDLIELRLSEEQDVYLARHFYPISEDIALANPYNAGTDLAGVPWRDTYFDAMRRSYRPRLMDYYGIPTSLFTVRLYYNRTLFRQIFGRDRLPRDYHDFIAMCEHIRRYSQAHLGGRLFPLAGSKYQFHMLSGPYYISLAAGLTGRIDYNLNGLPEEVERFLGLASGDLDLLDPKMQAAHVIAWRLTRYFPGGFYAADRQDAVFQFVQQRAAMIATGSWDSGALTQHGQFEVGVFRFPFATADDPWFGRYCDGPFSEAEMADAGGSYGITRFTRHRELALDFLRFLTSQPMNAVFNHTAHWIPCIRGTRPPRGLEAFAPKLDGFASAPWPIYGQAGTRYHQAQSALLGTLRIPDDEAQAQRHLARAYRALMAAYAPHVARLDPHDFQMHLKTQYDRERHMERMLALFTARALRASDPRQAAEARRRYLQMLQTQIALTAWTAHVEQLWTRWNAEGRAFQRLREVAAAADACQD